jgi:hypothetical protein
MWTYSSPFNDGDTASYSPDTVNSQYPQVIMTQGPYGESNFDATKLHGVAASAGTTIDVTLEHGIHTGLSGLTTGTKYFVTDSGGISTSGSAKLGTAINATSLALDFTDELTSADLGTYATKSYVATQTFSGSYNDLTNQPTIPTNNNQLTNGAGYVTSAQLDGDNTVVSYSSTSSASANDVMMLNTDGTVTPIEVTTFPTTGVDGNAPQIVPSSTRLAGSTNDGSVVGDAPNHLFKLDGNKYLSVGRHEGGASNFYGVYSAVAEYNSAGSGSWTWGNVYDMNNTNWGTVNWNSEYYNDPYVLRSPDNPDKFLFFKLRTGGSFAAIIGTVNGLTISWSDYSQPSQNYPSSINNSYNVKTEYDYAGSSAGNYKFIVWYGTASDMKAFRVVWDGDTTITWEDEVTISTGGIGSVPNGNINPVSASFSRVTEGRLCVHNYTTGSLQVYDIDWVNGTTQVGNNFSITASSSTDGTSNYYGVDVKTAWNPLTDEVISINRLASGTPNIRFRRYSVDATRTITANGAEFSPHGFYSSNTYWLNGDFKFFPKSNVMFFSHARKDGGYDMNAIHYLSTDNASSFTQYSGHFTNYYPFGPTLNWPFSARMYSDPFSSGQGSMSYTDRSSGVSRLEGNPLQGEYVESNLDKSKIHGLAATSGTTPDVTTQFGVHSGLSGLTVGSKYYVLDDGTLSTTPDTHNAKIGVAVKSTHIALDFIDELTESDLTTYATKSYVATQTFSGSYNDLTNQPTIPANTSQLANNSGFITAADVPNANVVEYTSTTAASVDDVIMLNSDGTVTPVAVTTTALNTNVAELNPAGGAGSNFNKWFSGHYPSDPLKVFHIYRTGSSWYSQIIEDNTYWSTHSFSGGDSGQQSYPFVSPVDESKVLWIGRDTGSAGAQTFTAHLFSVDASKNITSTSTTHDIVPEMEAITNSDGETWGSTTTISGEVKIIYDYAHSSTGSYFFNIFYEKDDIYCIRVEWDGVNAPTFGSVISVANKFNNRDCSRIKLDPNNLGRWLVTDYSGYIRVYDTDYANGTSSLTATYLNNSVDNTLNVHHADWNPKVPDQIFSLYSDAGGLKTNYAQYTISGSSITLIRSNYLHIAYHSNNYKTSHVQFFPNSDHMVMNYNSSSTRNSMIIQAPTTNTGGSGPTHSKVLEGISSSWPTEMVSFDYTSASLHGSLYYPNGSNSALRFIRAGFTASNFDSNKLHGLAASAGTTIDVTLEHGIHTGLSGLTTGSAYYTNDEGVISTTVGGGSKIGTAINATSLALDFTDELVSADLATYATKAYVASQVPSLTGYATETYVNTSVANLVDSAPATLDTLNELAAALGDDANFSTTITNQIAAKADAYSTVSVTTSSGKFYIDGEQQSIATLQPGRTYRFDQSAASNNSHPLRFSEVEDGTHAGGGATEYTTGVTVNGTAGNAGAYVEIAVTNATPRLYYYCANHTGMGGKVSVGKELFVERITSDTWITGPIQTTSVNVGTGGQINAALATLDFTNTTVNFSGATIAGLSNSDVGLANIADNAQGVVVTGKVAAGSLDLGTGGSINAQLGTLDFTHTTVNFSGANVGGLGDTIQDEVDFHLNKDNSAGQTIISDGQVLSWNATGGLQGTGDYEWVTQSGGGASVTTSSTAPTSPSDGDLWFDTDELKTYVYYNDGTSSQWVQSNPTGAIGGGGTSIEISDVAPTSPSAGDLWFDSDALKTFIYYDDGSGAQWIESSGGSSISDTDALSEGSTNLYYTDARVDTHLNVSSATNGQTLIWNGTDYSWGTPAPGYTSSDFDTDFATKSTTDVVEGTNLYYTDARVQTKLGDVSGHIIPDTDVTYDLGSSTHKFRDLYLSGNSIILGGITLTESSGELLVTPTGGGSNNTFATESFVNTAIANLVDTAPTTLDTLNELAAALGDDANFSVTITNSIATKLALSGGTMSGNIDMANNELLNVNYITFADPGPNEGLRWTGGNIEIFESPDDLTTNTAGNLQVTYSGTRRLSVSNTGIDVNGNITIPANATLSAGSSNKINIGNSSLDNVNKIFIADPGPNEGIEWLGGNAWQIYESPDDLVTNSGGNLQFVSGSPTSGIAPVRRMTLDVAGNLNLLTGSFIGNLAGNADTATTVSDISNHNTDDLSEGSTNLYYTESRVDARVAYAATGALSVTYTPKPIYAILKLTSNESFSGATWSKLDNFTTVSTDNSPSQAISDATNSRMIIPAGVEKVRLSAGARINDVAGQTMIQIYHYDSNNNQLTDGADTSIGYNELDSAGHDTVTTATPILEVNQGDYFEVWVYGQDGGSARVNRTTFFEMEVVEGSMLNTTVASTIELDHLSDVDTSTVAPTDGQALIWDNGNSEWKPGNVDVTSSDLDMGGNKVLFANMYATEGDLPSATTYHGMFAHVHSTGAGYFAHAGAWVKLANYSDIPSVYTDSAVDAHLNTSTAAANQVLSWNGTDYVWVAQASGGGGGGASVSVSDTAPSSPSEGDLWFNSLNTKMYVYFDDGTSSQWIQSNPSGASTPITASDSAPSNPVENSMWFDSTDGTLYFRYNDGTSEQWVNLIGATSSGGGSGGSSVTISDTAPTSPTEGDMWFDSRYAVLLVYYGTQWVNVSGESGSSTTPSWQETTNHTASAGDKLFIDCSGGVATVTLPASPSMGDEIRIIDATGNASTNNITVARNGNNIQGVADNLTIDTDRAAFGLVYYNSTQGWLLMER